MAKATPATSLQDSSVLTLLKSENAGASAVQTGNTTQVTVKKSSPFTPGSISTRGVSKTLIIPQGTKGVSHLSTQDSPTAPIQPIIDLLFNSDFMAEINQGFMEGLKSKDKSFESIDVVKNPQNYTTEQKLIMYLDLLQTKATFEKYNASLDGNGRISDNDQEILNDLQQSIDILRSDPGVNEILTEKILKAFKLIFSGSRVAPADPNKDASGLINDSITRDQKMKELRQKVEAAFQKDIVDGGVLSSGLKAGKDSATIAKEYSAALGFYSMVLPDNFVKKYSAAAEKTYAEFFDKNVLPNMADPSTALSGLINMGLGAGKSAGELKGLGSILPVVASDGLLVRGGQLFSNLYINLGDLKAVAANEFGSKVPNNVTHLFNPAIEAMANQFYGGKGDAEARQQLKTDVKALLGTVLDKVASGEVGPQDLAGYLERVTASLTKSGGKEINGYKHAVQTALQGLVMAASLVSKMPTSPDVDASKAAVPVSDLTSYSFNDVMGMILVATGLAGKGIAAGGSGSGRFFVGSGGDAWIAERMFGTKDNSWSKAVMGLNLDYINKDFLTSSVRRMGLIVSGYMKKALPGNQVIDPLVTDKAAGQAALEKIIGPSVDALAETYFKDNAAAMAQYKTNFVLLFSAIWGYIKPGGSIETIKSELGKLINKTVTSTPEGVDPAKYKAALASGVSAVLSASSAVYSDVNMTNASWDNIGYVVLHSLSALVHVGNALGSGIKASNFSLLAGIPSLLGNANELARAERSVLSAAFKNSSTVLAAAVGVGWLPIEYFQFIKALSSGTADKIDLSFFGIGMAADTVGAIEGLTSVGNMLVNSALLGRTGATVALASGAFSAAFAVFGAISWAAWSGYVIYQSFKQDKKFGEATDAMNAMLKRTVNDNVSLYHKTGKDTGIKGGGFHTGNGDKITKKEYTPENWSAIKANIEKNRAGKTT